MEYDENGTQDRHEECKGKVSTEYENHEKTKKAQNCDK